MEADNSRYELHTRKYIKDSYDHIHNVIYRRHLLKGIFIVSFELISRQENYRHHILTNYYKWRMHTLNFHEVKYTPSPFDNWIFYLFPFSGGTEKS